MEIEKEGQDQEIKQEANAEVKPEGVQPETAQEANAEIKTVEQVKREAIADEYAREIAPARDARSAAIEAHEKEFTDRWAKLQGDIARVRSEVEAKLVAENVPENQRKPILDMETAKLYEQHEVAKHAAGLKLDQELPAPKKWLDFLVEKSASNDPVVLDLLEEAKREPGATITGTSDGKPRGVYLNDLSFKADTDVVKYLRGKDEIIMDRGHRLDVKRLDDRDISAALQIAAQKFDMDKGLILSGDHAFRVRSAELAGRMGYKVQNMSPEMQKAWERGQNSAAVLKQVERPSVANSISGDAKKPEHVILKVDQRIDIQKLLEANDGLKAGPSVNSLLMDPEHYMGAMDAWRNTDPQTLDALAHADINKADGGLDVQAIASSAPEMVKDHGLSDLAKELVLIRDAKTLASREVSPTPEIYKTSQDRAAEYEARQQEINKSLDKQLLVRNINEQDQAAEKSKIAQAVHQAVEHVKEKVKAERENDPYAFLKAGKEQDVKDQLIDKAQDVAVDQVMNAAGAPQLGQQQAQPAQAQTHVLEEHEEHSVGIGF